MKQLILIVSLILLSFIPFNKMNETDRTLFTNNNDCIIIKPDNPDKLSAFQKISKSKLNASGNISDDWYSAAIEKISIDEYNITYSDNLKSYQSPNRANNIRFIYHKDGFTAAARETKIPLFDANDRNIRETDRKYKEVEDWNVDLKIKDNATGITNEDLTSAGNKAWIENENIRIDYTNSREGMRQDFIIKKKLPDENELSLAINVSTTLNMSVSNEAVTFTSNDGSEKMRYSSLKAWDADNKELKAYFEKTDDKQFAIRVDDRDAKYPVTIDPISTSPDWQKSGDWGSDFGYSVSAAGDINLDGYSDIIIGAPGFDNTVQGNNRGKIFAYYGSSSGLHSVEDWSFTGDQTNARLGTSVSSAGDVNGDGFPDIIASAPYYSDGQTNEGRVYVFYGSATGLGNTPAWILNGNKEFAKAGYSVSKAGDFNNDGYGDVIIGLPGYENVMFTGYGSVSIFLGSSSGLSSDPFISFRNYHDNIGLGNSVSYAGDVNGDGFSDVIFGSPYWPPPPLNSATELESNGRVNVVYGSNNGSLTGWNAEGETSHSLFGYSVSTAGDVNNDGYDDILIGSPNYFENSPTTGKVYVYLGSSAGLQTIPSWTLNHLSSGNQIDGLGRSVSSAGDLNADGFSDIIIGAHYTGWDQTMDTIKGAALVYYGSSSGLSQYLNWRYDVISGVNTNQITVSGAGDVNGDGYSDIILGINGLTTDIFQYPYLKAMVFNGGNTTITPACDWTTSSDQPFSRFGFSVSAAGDVNNDSFDDVIISAPVYDNGETDEGKVFVYHGSATGLDSTPAWSAEGNAETARFGFSVSGAGDVNNDGYSDIIIGAPYYGNAYVYHGSSSGLMNTPNWTGHAYSGNSNFGFSVSDAGDVNNDGYSDIVVGSNPFQTYNGHNTGAFIYFGSDSGIMGTDPSWTASLPSPYPTFGAFVSSAGDVNNDGYDDVIVSEFSYQNLIGKVYCYYGSGNRGMYDPENWSAEGSGGNPNFGISVSGAGDVNGDGFDDILAGSTGKVYAFYGSSTGLSVSYNWFVSGSEFSFGHSVSGAGDFNNDSYDDIIIGEDWIYNPPGSFIYFGSPAGLDNVADVSMDIGGTSVSNAGDINNDGYDDVIIGNEANLACVYYGKGNTVTYFQLTPKLIFSSLNSEVCISGIAKNQYNEPIKNLNILYYINGANPDSDIVISDSTGLAKICYTGRNAGIDTVIAVAGMLTDKVIISWDYPLPVELSTLTSTISGRDVTLSWSTSNELNNSGFEIERSDKSDEWTSRGNVEGSGTTNEPRQYTFTDKNLQSGNYKYRLKQTDFNGNYEYFELDESVSIVIPDKFSLSQNYPNPFNPVTNLEFGIPELGLVKLIIYDVMGREVVTLVNEIKEPGYYTVKFNAANLASGVYFYRMTAGEFTAVRKMVVLR